MNGTLHRALDLIESRKLRTLFGECEEYLFRYQNSDVVALSFGVELGSPTPVRIHSACLEAHYLGSVECDCREQLEMTLRWMEDLRQGVIVFLDQDGRGNGHAALMRSAVVAQESGLTLGDSYQILGYPADARDYRGAAYALRALGVEKALLRTNNPEKIDALTRAGVDVTPIETVAKDAVWLRDYYRSKTAEGHRLEVPE